MRVVGAVADRTELNALLASYECGGTSRYHPRMLLKVLLYGYLDGVRFSRRSTYYHRQQKSETKQDEAPPMVAKLMAWAEEFPTWSIRRMMAALQGDGVHVNR